MDRSQNSAPRLLIIGAGFAGLKAAAEAAKHNLAITVVDRRNHHTFQPLLYQVATAGLSPGEIAGPIRGVLRKYSNIEVLLGEVDSFDLAQKKVGLRDGSELSYDYLIVASGATHSYFGHDEWEELAPGLKTIEDATEIRRRVLLAFELAERRAHISGYSEPVHFVVVGGGPTGVELAGTLAEVGTQGARAKLPAHRSDSNEDSAARRRATHSGGVSGGSIAKRATSTGKAGSAGSNQRTSHGCRARTGSRGSRNPAGVGDAVGGRRASVEPGKKARSRSRSRGTRGGVA